MSRSILNYKLFFIQFCVLALVLGLICGCKKEDSDTSPIPSTTSAVSPTGPSVPGKGPSMPGKGPSMPGAGPAAPGATKPATGPTAAFPGPGPKPQAAGPAMPAKPGAAKPPVQTSVAKANPLSKKNDKTDKTQNPSIDQINDTQQVALEVVVPVGKKLKQVKNWDGKVTRFLCFKAKGPAGQKLVVEMPEEYGKLKMTKLGWSTFFLTYAMNEETRVDAEEKTKLPDLSAATDLMNDILGKGPVDNTPSPAASPRGNGPASSMPMLPGGVPLPNLPR